MSRWTEQFENHPFQAIWGEIIELSKELDVDDSTVVTSVEEIARLKKIIVFLDDLLKSCDPEFIPETTWNNFNSQSTICIQEMRNYQSNRNIAHVKKANGNLDNLLTYIRPYQVVTSKVAKSAQKSFLAYTKTINENLNSFQEESKSLLSEMNDLRDSAVVNVKKVDTVKIRIKELETQYFEDNETELSLSTRIGNFETKLVKNYENINNYRVELLDGDSESDSISTVIKLALDKSNEDTSSINNLLSEVKNKLADFSSFHTDIFGNKNEDGKFEGGLKDEMIAREAHLDEFKLQQETKYKAFNEEIESLLPGATSAGLATAYYDLKVSFNNPIKSYTKMFYGSIGALILVALISITQEFGWFYIKFVDTTDLSKIFSNILYKLPIVLPVIWITLFASKRRSEFLRLQQEYAHKEALAKSYQSFKKQINELNQEDPVLMEKLLSSAIDAVSSNASETLDKKHGDKSPVHEGVDGFVSTIEKVKKAIEIDYKNK